MIFENILGIAVPAELARVEEKVSKRKAKELFEKGILDDNYSMLLSSRPNLSLIEVEMLNRVLMKKNLVAEEIAHLRNLKLIEGRKPNIFISKSVAQSAGKKIEYTKNKGFDDNYYKDLILKALGQHEIMSRRDIENLLLSKLPDILSQSQKVSKITNLLTLLRVGGKIETAEKRMW